MLASSSRQRSSYTEPTRRELHIELSSMVLYSKSRAISLIGGIYCPPKWSPSVSECFKSVRTFCQFVRELWMLGLQR